jgi:hypothetical protein
MRAARLIIFSVVLLAIPFVASATAMENALPPAPKSLHGFQLRPNEPVSHSFSRTPAFAWAPVRGAACYEFELATSRAFGDSSIVWSNVSTDVHSGRHCTPVTANFPLANAPGQEGASGAEAAQQTVSVKIAPIKIPAVSIDLVLPWFTGRPYALYAHVRSVTTEGASSWSRPFGFNMRWEDAPVPLATKPGLVRWTPVEGATGYEVWYGGRGPTGTIINKIVQTHTNVADQRDVHTFHLDEGWWRTVEWRVRAMRVVVGAAPNGLPAVSYGPWTNIYATTNPPWSSGKLKVNFAVSDEISTATSAASHQLMPGLTWTGDQGLDGGSYRLFRAYASTDRDCVNVVFRGSVVGSPAFAPRVNGPLKLPKEQDELDRAFFRVLPNSTTEEAKTFTADTFPLVSNESFGEDRSLLRVDLPDLDVRTTRYFWTVVPVGILVDEETQEFTYWDIDSPQDACQSGRVVSFGKESLPAITTSGSPYVSGLSPNGRLLAQAGSSPTVYSTPLVAWRPVVGATQYEVQWSRTKYPWRKRGSTRTFATSTVLKLSPGLWYYRVRGLNVAQVGTPAMTWSAPVAVKVAKPTFRVSG